MVGAPAPIRSRIMLRLLSAICALAALAAAAGAGASADRANAEIIRSAAAADQADETVLASLRDADLALFRVFDRLVTANAALCDRKAGSAGMLVHSLATYASGLRDSAKAFFSFAGPVAVEEVLPGGPAARAGVARNDSILSIAGAPLPLAAYDRRQLAALLRELGAAGADGRLDIGVLRGGRALTFQIGTIPSCAALLELRITPRLGAATDGDIIQVDTGLYNLVAGDEAMLAAVVAHELGHVVLDHPRRLDEAKVSRGPLRGFGRSGRLWRRTETEADLLSVYLLANAGYDPGAAAALWERHGRRIDPILGLPTHSGWRTRARSLAAEAAKVRATTQRPAFPGWFRDRHRPLD